MFPRYGVVLFASTLAVATAHAAVYSIGADGDCTHTTIATAAAAADTHPGPDTIHIAYNQGYAEQVIAKQGSESTFYKPCSIKVHSDPGFRLVVAAKTSGPQFMEIAGETVVVTGKLFALAFDLDNDDATGSSPKFVLSVKGVERQAAIETCADETDKSAEPHCVHGFWDNHLASAHTRVKIRDLTDRNSDEVAFESGKVTPKDDVVRIEIPYAKLGASAGDTVRVYALGWQASGMFGALAKPVGISLE